MVYSKFWMKSCHHWQCHSQHTEQLLYLPMNNWTTSHSWNNVKEVPLAPSTLVLRKCKKELKQLNIYKFTGPDLQCSGSLYLGRKGSALVWHTRGRVFEPRLSSKSCDLEAAFRQRNTSSSESTAHEGGGCDQSIGSNVSDAILRCWLWSTTTWSSPLGCISCAPKDEHFGPLTHIFNNSVSTGIIPENWKSAYVTAVTRNELQIYYYYYYYYYNLLNLYKPDFNSIKDHEEIS